MNTLAQDALETAQSMNQYLLESVQQEPARRASESDVPAAPALSQRLDALLSGCVRDQTTRTVLVSQILGEVGK